jgi:hypothetical protein
MSSWPSIIEEPRSVSSESNPPCRPETVRVDWLSLWILFSAWCPISGWTLSLLGCLNRTGICVSGALFIAFVFAIARRLELVEKASYARWRLVRSRWILPRLWLLLTVLTLAGGIIYTPNNYDYLTYRFPRLLHWCWEQRWYWIPTINHRMNFSGTQFEWMMAPLFILFKTDRLFFLLNFVSYLLFPGLIFSVFNGLGLSKRISWWWMWVLPCGYCYVLQAASVGNDSFAVIYLFASLHYLFRAKVSSPAKNLAFSVLAIGLLTGAKASNLPLVLPWLTLLFFTREALFERSAFLAVTLAAVAALVASFVPTALLNRHYTGDFFGDPTNQSHMKVPDPVGGIVGNFLQISVENLAPPLWPKPVSWNPELPSSLKAMMDRDFPRLDLSTEEFPIEEGAGAGLGIVLGVVPFLTAGIRSRLFARRVLRPRGQIGVWISAAMGVACLVYMAKIGNEAASRLVAPYYALIVGCVMVLVSIDGRLLNRSLFRCAGLLAMLCAFPLVILSPSRPLFPVELLHQLEIRLSPPMADRFENVYTLYASRADVFHDILPFLPSGERVVGLMQAGNDCQTSLWRPFGSREIREVMPADTLSDLQKEGIHTIVIGQDALGRFHTDINSLANRWSGHVVTQKAITLQVHEGKETWYVLHVD